MDKDMVISIFGDQIYPSTLGYVAMPLVQNSLTLFEM